MIVVDTNVVSEPMRVKPSAAVVAWLDRQAVVTLYITSINLAELLVGIDARPAGRRRTGLRAALDDVLATFFGPRVLPFDADAAREYARVVTRAAARGHVLPVADAQIAAIAACHGFTVATRDAAPFRAAGVEVIDPWGAV